MAFELICIECEGTLLNFRERGKLSKVSPEFPGIPSWQKKSAVSDCLPGSRDEAFPACFGFVSCPS
jgi:hypothetical protein